MLPIEIEFPIEIVSALVGVFGAIGGGLISYFLISSSQKRREKISRAIQLIDQYCSPDFIVIRNKAGAILRRELAKEEISTWNSLHKSLEDDWLYVSQLEHFYKRVRFLIEQNEACPKITKNYFLIEFNHWYIKYLKKIEVGSYDAGDIESKEYENLHRFFSQT